MALLFTLLSLLPPLLPPLLLSLLLQVNKGVPSWKAYVDYFSNIVIDGFSSAIICTIRYLLSQIDPEVGIEWCRTMI